MPWMRETVWRQGSLLSADNLRQLGIINGEEDFIAIAISHDCDIANDNLDQEPVVEFAIGQFIDEPDGNYEFSKNPRTLHIPIYTQEGDVTGELQAKDKVTVEKDTLCNFEPTQEMGLSRKNLDILQNWLAARYKRHTLPNALVDRLGAILSFLNDKGKRKAHSLIAYWIDYEPFGEEIPPDQPYEFWIYLVYSIEKADAQAQIVELADKLREVFPDLISKNNEAGHVDLRGCEAYSEEEFTLSDVRGNIEYRLDSISLKLDPPGPLATK